MEELSVIKAEIVVCIDPTNEGSLKHNNNFHKLRIYIEDKLTIELKAKSFNLLLKNKEEVSVSDVIDTLVNFRYKDAIRDAYLPENAIEKTQKV